MRMPMKVQIPTEEGNDAIKDGSLPQNMASSLDALKAEAAYFIAEDGMRTALSSIEATYPGGRAVVHGPERRHHPVPAMKA